MVNSEKHHRQVGCIVIVIMMLFVVINDAACRRRQSNNSGQQDDPYRRAVTQFLFATCFNRKNSKHVSTPPPIDAEKYLLQLLTPPMQIESNAMQNITITSPTIQDNKNEKEFIQYLAKKPQLQRNIIMENNQYPMAKGRSITFICNPSYCYEIDKDTGKKTYYICNESYCYAII